MKKDGRSLKFFHLWPMGSKIEHWLFIILGVLALLALALLFLGPKDLLGEEATTEFILKTACYPLVLIWLVLAWRKIDKKLNTRKPGE